MFSFVNFEANDNANHFPAQISRFAPFCTKCAKISRYAVLCWAKCATQDISALRATYRKLRRAIVTALQSPSQSFFSTIPWSLPLPSSSPPLPSELRGHHRLTDYPKGNQGALSGWCNVTWHNCITCKNLFVCATSMVHPSNWAKSFDKRCTAKMILSRDVCMKLKTYSIEIRYHKNFKCLRK